MSERLHVLTDEDVDDEVLTEAANAAHAVLKSRDVDVEGVAPDLREDHPEPRTTLVYETMAGEARRVRVRPHPDPGVAGLLREERKTAGEWGPAGSEQLDHVEIDGVVWQGEAGVDLGP